MCRIFGIANNMHADPEDWTTGDIARILGAEMIKGGPHAFGWMYNNNGQVTQRQFTGKMTEQMSKTFSIPRDVEWFVGHIRYATHGPSTNHHNVHPLLHGDVLGVHNGVLSNHVSILKKTGRQYEDTEVDSEAIFAAVNKWGHEKGLAKVQGDLVALYTLLSDPESLYIARSGNRFLRLGYTTKGNLIFASEQRALDVLDMAGVEFTHFSGITENRVLRIKNGAIFERATYRRETPPVVVQDRWEWTDADVATAVNWDATQRDMARARKRGLAWQERVNNRKRTNEAPAAPRAPIALPAVPLPPKPVKRTQQLAKRVPREVGVPQSDGQIKYRGKIMPMDDYIKLVSQDLAEDMYG